MRKYFFLSSLVFIVACSGTKMLAPTDADVQRGVDNFPGLTLEDLNQGQQVFQANCNKCHPYKKPGGHSAAEWKEIVPRMVQKANRKTPDSVTPAMEASLLRYVAVMSTAKK